MMKSIGTLFFLSGCLIFLGILLAEIFYPLPYSLSQNMISNLGATPPPNSLVFEPSAKIFDLSLIISGTLALIGGFLLIKEKKYKYFPFAILIMGAGTAGVGIFPAFHLFAHPVSALTAFAAGGAAALLSIKLTKPPFSLISLVLGLTTLTTLFLSLFFPETIVPLLGRGGAERLVAYPVILWLTAFGAYLLNS